MIDFHSEYPVILSAAKNLLIKDIFIRKDLSLHS